MHGQQVTPSQLPSNSDSTASTSADTIREVQSAIPKRKREALEGGAADAAKDEAGNQVKPHPMLPLPRRHKAHHGPAVLPKPSTSNVPRQPSCLANVDAVVQDAALSACLEGAMQASRTTPPLPNWAVTNDGDRQDAPPDSSDDEVPLSVKVAVKAEGDCVLDAPLARVIAARSLDADADESRSRLPLRNPSLMPPPPLQAEPYVPPTDMASVGPKPGLPVKPPIWAEVSEKPCHENLL